MSVASGRLTIVHVSDVHGVEHGLLFGAVDPLDRLARLADHLELAHVTPEAIVVTGDLAHRGHAGAYPAVAAALERLGERLGAPVVTTLGNHDDAEASRVLPGHEASHHGVVDADGLRIVRLDSRSGALGAAQLDWLREVLATAAPLGTVVALHHPPIASPLPGLAGQHLADADALLELLEGTDVRAVLAGHYHHPASATVRGLTVSVAPSLAYHQRMHAGLDGIAGHDTSMFSLVHLLHDGVQTASVSLTEPAPIFTIPIPSSTLKH
ncbi:metallophosphoesterase family protein [Agrococcus jejuensis]|uniref:metallophosphoesterase family protein n=1 Tax=Agrococcus jejuensis TaxID=399736 RepID=UPI0011A5848C|nr:metallophosphoesterase [Agrococcus jejuensis]